MANKTEKDLKAFIKDTKKFAVAFNLRPHHNKVDISPIRALNIVEVRIPQENGMPCLFIFRGVREKYYDKLQKKHAKHIGFKYSGGAVEIL
jgi:hypothetical protein